MAISVGMCYKSVEKRSNLPATSSKTLTTSLKNPQFKLQLEGKEEPAQAAACRLKGHVISAAANVLSWLVRFQRKQLPMNMAAAGLKLTPCCLSSLWLISAPVVCPNLITDGSCLFGQS